MDAIAGVVSAALAVYVIAAVMSLLVRLRRPDETEFGLLAALATTLSFATAAHLAMEAARNASAAERFSAARLEIVALVAVFAVFVHFGVDYGRVRRKTRWLVLAYGSATAFELLNARGLLHVVDVTTAGVEPAWVAPPSALGYGMYGAFVVATLGVLYLLARSYLAGRREALWFVIGSTIVLAGSLNDLAFHAGKLGTTDLADISFIVVIVGGCSTLISRYVVASRELHRRTLELRTRTRELRRSYEELRAAQEELVKKEQLAVVGELAAVIAHEVRNPLAIIGNAVSGLRKPTLARDDQATLLSILDEETTRLNRLVTDLLRYARPVNVQRQHISVQDLLERGLQLVRMKKQIRAELKIDAPDVRMWGDSNLLRQVFDNLIDNAVQAMNGDGTLTVRVRAAQQEGEDGVAVDIIDTGEGMDTMVRQRALDPFFTTRPSGTGLGLAIVDRIVDAHGGRFLIESRSGEGTTATVFLPSGSASEPPRAGTRKSTSSVPPASIAKDLEPKRPTNE